MRNYKYHTRNKLGQVIFSTNDYYAAVSLAEAFNYEIIESLPKIRIGRKLIEGRFRVLRKITN